MSTPYILGNNILRKDYDRNFTSPLRCTTRLAGSRHCGNGCAGIQVDTREGRTIIIRRVVLFLFFSPLLLFLPLSHHVRARYLTHPYKILPSLSRKCGSYLLVCIYIYIHNSKIRIGVLYLCICVCVFMCLECGVGSKVDGYDPFGPARAPQTPRPRFVRANLTNRRRCKRKIQRRKKIHTCNIYEYFHTYIYIMLTYVIHTGTVLVKE